MRRIDLPKMSQEHLVRGFTPEQAAEITGLYSKEEFRDRGAKGVFPCHRGARRKVVFFMDDLMEIVARHKQPAADTDTTLRVVGETQVGSPFRTTSRSNAAHRGGS